MFNASFPVAWVHSNGTFQLNNMHSKAGLPRVACVNSELDGDASSAKLMQPDATSTDLKKTLKTACSAEMPVVEGL